MSINVLGGVKLWQTVQVFTNYSSFPNTGNEKNIYIAQDTGNVYIWNNSAYKSVNNSKFLGYYTTPTALQTAHPTANDGDFAVVGTTDTIWVWDSTDVQWEDSGQKMVAAGADTQIQYNDNGNFGATSDFTWNNSSKILQVNGASNITGELTQAKTKVITKTGNYTLTEIDGLNLVVINSVSAVTITVPQTSTESINQGVTWFIYNIGSGDVTITKEGADILNGNTLVQQGDNASIIKTIAGTPNTYDILGGTKIYTFTIEKYIYATLTNGTYRIARPRFDGTITNIIAILDSGTVDLNVSISGVGVTHTTLNVSSTETSQAATGNNIFDNSDYIEITLANALTPVNLLLTLECIGRL